MVLRMMIFHRQIQRCSFALSAIAISFSFIFGLACIGASNPASAQNTLRPIAVINGDIVSILDLNMRARMAIIGSDLPNTAEQTRRIAPQVLRRLIEESLLMREAERLSINITEEQIDEAFAQVATGNNLTPEEFEESLKRQGIFPSALRDQIKAQIAWNAIIELTIRPQIEINEVEIEDAVEMALSGGGSEELRLAEIFISVPNNRNYNQAIEKAEVLIGQVRDGANFLGLAREFSESVSRQVGGDLGWVSPQELDEELTAAANSLVVGQVSAPIKIQGGVTVLLLMDKRIRTEESINRDAIEQKLIEQRVNLRAQRVMQELWQTADVDVRMR